MPDRHHDITFSDCMWLKGHHSFPYFLEKHLAIPISPFTSKWLLCYSLRHTLAYNGNNSI